MTSIFADTRPVYKQRLTLDKAPLNSGGNVACGMPYFTATAWTTSAESLKSGDMSEHEAEKFRLSRDRVYKHVYDKSYDFEETFLVLAHAWELIRDDGFLRDLGVLWGQSPTGKTQTPRIPDFDDDISFEEMFKQFSSVEPEEPLSPEQEKEYNELAIKDVSQDTGFTLKLAYTICISRKSHIRDVLHCVLNLHSRVILRTVSHEERENTRRCLFAIMDHRAKHVHHSLVSESSFLFELLLTEIGRQPEKRCAAKILSYLLPAYPCVYARALAYRNPYFKKRHEDRLMFRMEKISRVERFLQNLGPYFSYFVHEI